MAEKKKRIFYCTNNCGRRLRGAKKPGLCFKCEKLLKLSELSGTLIADKNEGNGNGNIFKRGRGRPSQKPTTSILLEETHLDHFWSLLPLKQKAEIFRSWIRNL